MRAVNVLIGWKVYTRIIKINFLDVIVVRSGNRVPIHFFKTMYFLILLIHASRKLINYNTVLSHVVISYHLRPLPLTAAKNPATNSDLTALLSHVASSHESCEQFFHLRETQAVVTIRRLNYF